MLEGRLQDGDGHVDHAVSSSCCWHFCAEHVEQCYSCREDALSPIQELSLRKSYCTFMQKLGKQLKLPQVTIATAIIFCHRFFLRQSLARNDRYIIATVCTFLAGKVEETPERLHNVIVVSYELRHAEDLDAASRIKQKEVYEEQKDLLLMGERLVLVTLGFNLNVAHPYKPLIAAIKRLTLPHTISRSQLAQIAWNFVNDGLQTLLCLQFRPCLVAAGALFLAAKFLRIKICDWEELLSKEFDVSLQQLEDVSNQILHSYESLAELSVNSSGNKKLIRVRGNLKRGASNEACTYSSEDLATATPIVTCEGDSQWPSIQSKAKEEDEIETTVSYKTHPGRFDVENATCHTGHSDLTEEKGGPELTERSYHPEEENWEYDRGRSHEEFERSCDYFFSMEDVDGRSTDRLWHYGRERKMKRVDEDGSPFEKGRDGAIVGMSKHNPWVRIGSRHRGIRQVPSRREPLVGLFGSKKDMKRAVTRREFLLRLSNKRKPAKASVSTPDHLNVRLQNRLKLLRQKDEILKKHQSWGSREHCMKRPR